MKLDVHSSNLAATLHYLDKGTNQFAFATVLDPRCFGGGASRPRYYMPAYGRKMMASNELTEDEAYAWTTCFLKRFADHGIAGVSDFLLPEDSTIVKDFSKNASKMPAAWDSDVAVSLDRKWPKMHMDTAR